MPSDFGALASDSRLHRILGPHDGACSLELWVLQLKVDESTETRLLYGRVLPSRLLKGVVNARQLDEFKTFTHGLRAQVIKLSLFCKASQVGQLLNKFVSGGSLRDSAFEGGVTLSRRVELGFSQLHLWQPLGFRPVMHLPSRDYFRRATKRLSPLDAASADSAAITSLAKSEIFQVDGKLDSELAKFAADYVSADTGMDFSRIDAWRLGDIELLVLPALNDEERLLVTSRSDYKQWIIGVEGPITDLACDLEVRVNFLNDDGVYSIASRRLATSALYPAQILIDFPVEMGSMLDAVELEIDAVETGSGNRRPCVRWGVHLIREMHQQMHVAGGSVTVKNDWLALALKPIHRARLDAVQQLARRTVGMSSVIGGRKADPWVPANRQIGGLLDQLVPQKSEGRFYDRVYEGDSAGRLEFAEWLRKLFAEHRDKQIAWFDPYMEDVGINLINLNGADQGSYIVFTGLPKKPGMKDWLDRCYRVARDWKNRFEKKKPKPERDPYQRIENLKAACMGWASRHASVSLRVVGLKEGELHDRMILIRSSALEPIAGYHLSNSVQLAAENYPLLITPIPPDVFIKVFGYVDSTLKKALSPGEASESAATMVFDSSAIESSGLLESPVRLTQFTVPRAGEVLAWWTDDFSLTSLSGDELKEALQSKGHSTEDGLRGPTFEVVPAKLWTDFNLRPFNSAWDAFGVIFAHTTGGDGLRLGAPKSPELITHLVGYLDPARADAVQPKMNSFGTVNMTEHLRESLSDLMGQAADPERMFGYGGVEVSWGDYYAIKVLWYTAPEELVRWIELGASHEWTPDRRRQLGLKAAIEVITSAMSWTRSKEQLDALVGSSNDFLKWMGYVAFESELEIDPKAVREVHNLPKITLEERRKLLGWLINRSGRRDRPTRGALIGELLDSYKNALSAADLTALLDSMRNFLKRIYSSPPWILQDILAPLVERKLLDVDLIAKAWFDELLDVWVEDQHGGGILFRAPEEGHFTKEVAKLVSLSSAADQKTYVERLQKEIKEPRAIVLTPLSSQRDWTRFDRAIVKIMWLGVLVDQILREIARPSRMEAQLIPILEEIQSLVRRRPTEDWERSGINDLVHFWNDTNPG